MSLRVARNRIAFGAVALTMVMTACATGPRPSLVDEPTATDTVAQAVLDRLERGTSATFTADYEITPSLTASCATGTPRTACRGPRSCPTGSTPCWPPCT